MTTLEKIELSLIPVLGLVFFMGAGFLPGEVSTGRFLLLVSVFILFQGLIRDLVLLANMKRQGLVGDQRKEACMCLESTVGMLGVLVGILLIISANTTSLLMTDISWSLTIVVSMLLGFFIKDYVIGWRPLSIKRDKDHLNIVVVWK